MDATLILQTAACRRTAVNGKCGFETDVNNYSLLFLLKYQIFS